MMENLLRSSFEGVEIQHVRMAFSRTMGELGRPRARKLALLPVVILQIVLARLRGGRVLYYPPAGPEKVAMYRDLVLLLATRWMFPKTIFHFHAGGISELYPTLGPGLRWLFRRAYFSPDIAIRTSALAPPDPALIGARVEVVVENGIEDVAPRPPLPPSPDRAHPATILYVGLLRESKGVLVLLDACALLRARGLAFRLELVGAVPSPEMETRLRRTVRDRGMEDVVVFRGVLVGKAKHDAFAAADIFCFPTFFESETFGVVLVEAMQFSLPVVATAWRGIPAVVEDRVTGFLVPVADSEALAERLAQLIAEPSLRQAMGSRGRARYESRYSLPRFRDDMQAVFELLRTELASSRPDQPVARRSQDA